MLPGKKYELPDAVAAVRKRIWLVLVPFALVGATTAVVARQFPNTYRSQAVIVVVPQQVPENYVRSAVMTKLGDRLKAIQQEILSRSKLEQIILDFNLYPEERKNGIMEDVIDQMRGQVKVGAPMGSNAFPLSYVGDSPRTVQQVTARLATLFIDENRRARDLQAEGTNQFLEGELELARKRLVDHEKKLEAYNVKFRGQLPTQLQANLQGAQGSMMQLQQVVESTNSDRQQKLFLERSLRDLEAAPVPDPVPAGQALDASGNPVGGTATQQLVAARAALAGLLQRYSDLHPDVVRMKSIIRELEPKAEAEALARPVSEAGVSPAEAARRKKVEELQSAIEQLDRQIELKQAEERRLRQAAADYQQRVESTPARESDMAELTRDYATIQRTYTSLLQKAEDSRLASSLERRQIGEQFQLLEPATFSPRPYSPNRPLLCALGLLAGLGLGLGLVVLLEQRDGSFKTDDEVSNLTGLPVLAVVPLMQSDAEKRGTRRRALLLGLGCGSTVLAGLAVVAYTLVR